MLRIDRQGRLERRDRVSRRAQARPLQLGAREPQVDGVAVRPVVAGLLEARGERGVHLRPPTRHLVKPLLEAARVVVARSASEHVGRERQRPLGVARGACLGGAHPQRVRRGRVGRLLGLGEQGPDLAVGVSQPRGRSRETDERDAPAGLDA